MFNVRPAHHEDGPLLREIERLAGEAFRGVGLVEVADDEPPSFEELDVMRTLVGAGWPSARLVIRSATS